MLKKIGPGIANVCNLLKGVNYYPYLTVYRKNRMQVAQGSSALLRISASLHLLTSNLFHLWVFYTS
jgi:hypothetical protein